MVNKLKALLYYIQLCNKVKTDAKMNKAWNLKHDFDSGFITISNDEVSEETIEWLAILLARKDFNLTVIKPEPGLYAAPYTILSISNDTELKKQQRFAAIAAYYAQEQAAQNTADNSNVIDLNEFKRKRKKDEE